MKKLQIIAWSCFLVGLIIKIPHYPGSALLMIIGVLLLLIHSVLFLIKNAKDKLPESMLNIAFTVMTFYFLCRILYLRFGPLIFGYSILYILLIGVSIAAIIINFGNAKKIKLPQILLIIYYLFSIWISFIPSSEIFYFFNLNEKTQKANRIENFNAWDRYSWFLYGIGKQDEAIEANMNSQCIIEEKLKIEQSDYLLDELDRIKKHNEQIQEKSWIEYK